MFVSLGNDYAVNLDHVATIELISATIGNAHHYKMRSEDGAYLGTLDIYESGENSEAIDLIQSYGHFIEISPQEAVNLKYVAAITRVETRKGIDRTWRLSTSSGRTLGMLTIAAGDTQNLACQALARRGLILSLEPLAPDGVDVPIS